MAKVNVEYDTVAKTANVTIDGQAMKNLANLMVYCDYMDEDEPKFCLEMASMEYDKEHDMRKINRVMANKLEKTLSIQEQIQHRLFSSAYLKK